MTDILSATSISRPEGARMVPPETGKPAHSKNAPAKTLQGFVRVARSARAQSQERRSRNSPRCPGRVHRRVRLRQIVAGIRHALRRGPAALSRIGRALRPAAVPSDGRARGRRDRRPAAGRGLAAAARFAHHALVGRQRHDAFESAADALFACRHLSGRASRISTPSRSRPTPRKGPAPSATAWDASTK